MLRLSGWSQLVTAGEAITRYTGTIMASIENLTESVEKNQFICFKLTNVQSDKLHIQMLAHLQNRDGKKPQNLPL